MGVAFGLSSMDGKNEWVQMLKEEQILRQNKIHFKSNARLNQVAGVVHVPVLQNMWEKSKYIDVMI